MPKKRSDGRYSKQVTVGHKDGKPIRKTVYGKTQKELDKNFRELMLLVDKGIILADMGMTVTELYKQWYRLKREGKVKRNTECTYESLYKRIYSEIGYMKVKDVTIYTVEKFITDIEKEGHSGTASSILTKLLRPMFDFAIDNDIISKNPCRNISVKYDKKIKRILTKEEKNNISNCNCLSTKEKAFLFLLRYTGMRRGEILALSKTDIDKKNMAIYINKTVIDNNGKPYIQQSTKTESGNRTVPILVPLAKPLFNYIDNLDSDMLFLNRNGNILSSQSTETFFHNISKKAELGSDLSMHCFRHNFISECYKAGVDIKKLQKWVGHNDIKTTLNTYTKLEKEDIENADELNEFFSSQNTVKCIKRKFIS